MTTADRRRARAPVRTALGAAAHRDAAAALGQAAAEVRAVLEEARAQAAAVVDEAGRQGEQDAAAVRARERARAQREARGRVLRAQRAAYEELRRRGRAAVATLRDRPDYPDLLEQVRRRLLAELGPDADVWEPPDGGLVAEVPGRRIEATLDALADRALADLGGGVADLWAP
jgi:hypothetical protein